MKTEKQKKIDFAKALYLDYDSEGKKKHSLRDIEKQIRQKFDKPIHHQTIKNWAEKYKWNDLNAEIKQQSIQKAQDDKFTTEERLIEAKSDTTAKDYKNADNLANIGYNTVIAHFKNDPEGKKPNVMFRDAIAAIRLGTDIKFRISEIPDSEKKKTIQIIKIGDQEIEF